MKSTFIKRGKLTVKFYSSFQKATVTILLGFFFRNLDRENRLFQKINQIFSCIE